MKPVARIIPIILAMAVALCGADYRKLIIGKWELVEPRDPAVRLIVNFTDGENAISRDFEPNGKPIHTRAYRYAIDGNRLIMTEKGTDKAGSVEILLLTEKEFSYREGNDTIKFIKIKDE